MKPQSCRRVRGRSTLLVGSPAFGGDVGVFLGGQAGEGVLPGRGVIGLGHVGEGVLQQVGGVDCDPVSGELTYGLERLAMYVQGVDNVFDLDFNGRQGKDKVTYGDVFLQAEQEYSRFNFEHADTKRLIEHFRAAEAECKALLAKGEAGDRHLMVLPAYDQCIKASHIFNLLDARGVISVTERQAYILRVRDLAKACCTAWLQTQAGGAA